MRSLLVLIILGLLLYVFWPKPETPHSSYRPALPFQEMQTAYSLASRGFDFLPANKQSFGAIEERAYSAKATLAAYLEVNPSAAEVCRPALDLYSEIVSMCEKRRVLTMQLDSRRMKVAPALLAKTPAERQRIEQARLDQLQGPLLDEWAVEVESFKIRARALAEKMKVNEAFWNAQRTAGNR